MLDNLEKEEAILSLYVDFYNQYIEDVTTDMDIDLYNEVLFESRDCLIQEIAEVFEDVINGSSSEGYRIIIEYEVVSLVDDLGRLCDYDFADDVDVFVEEQDNLIKRSKIRLESYYNYLYAECVEAGEL